MSDSKPYLVPPRRDDPDPDALVHFTDAHLDQTLARLDAGLGTVVDASRSATSSLAYLSSGALALTLSFTQLVLGDGAEVSGGWLMISAWILFSFSIVSALVRQHQVVGILTPRLKVDSQRPEIRRKVRGLDREANDFAHEFDQILDTAFKAGAEEANSILKIYDTLGRLGVGSFTLGLGATIVFVFINAPL